MDRDLIQLLAMLVDRHHDREIVLTEKQWAEFPRHNVIVHRDRTVGTIEVSVMPTSEWEDPSVIWNETYPDRER